MALLAGPTGALILIGSFHAAKIDFFSYLPNFNPSFYFFSSKESVFPNNLLILQRPCSPLLSGIATSGVQDWVGHNDMRSVIDALF